MRLTTNTILQRKIKLFYRNNQKTIIFITAIFTMFFIIVVNQNNNQSPNEPNILQYKCITFNNPSLNTIRHEEILKSISQQCKQQQQPLHTGIIPIVFFYHSGPELDEENYAQITIPAATLLNQQVIYVASPDASNLLLKSPLALSKVQIVTFSLDIISEYTQRAIQFATTYVHMNTNPRSFELISFQRWFIIEAIMRKLKYDEFWYLDTDVLLLTDLTAEQACYQNCECVISSSPSSTSGHTSKWTLQRLSDFTMFMETSYSQSGMQNLANVWVQYKNKFQSNALVLGGICDMTLLKLFNDQSMHKCCHGNDNYGGVLSHNIKTDHWPEYFQDEWTELPYYYSNSWLKLKHDKIRIKTLHFQGDSKILLLECPQNKIF
jgi:hypothetical protein